MPHQHRHGYPGCPSKKTFWKKHKGAVCVFCGAPADTVDHKLAISKGGNNSQNNLAPACASCNNAKGSMDFDLFLRYSRRFGPINVKMIKNTNISKLHDIGAIYSQNISHEQKVQIVKRQYPQDWNCLLRRFNSMRKFERLQH